MTLEEKEELLRATGMTEAFVAGDVTIDEKTGRIVIVNPLSSLISKKPVTKKPIYEDKEIKDLVPNIKAGVFADPNKLTEFLSKLTGEKVFMKDGRAVYRKNAGLGKPGQLYSVLPESGIAATARDIPGYIADAPSVAAGTLTAPLLMTGPLGATASILGTGAVGAGSDLARQKAENYLLAGADNKRPVDLGRSGMTGSIDAATQLVPGIELMLRNLVKNVDVNRLDPQAMRKRMDLSEKYDIPLAVGEKTQLRSAKNLQNALGRYSQSADTMGGFYGMREEKVQSALEKLINDLFGQRSRTDKGMIGEDIRQTGEDVLKKRQEKRKAAVDPLYDAAEKTADPVQLQPTVNLINSMMNKYTQESEERKILGKIKGMLQKTIITKDKDGNRQTEKVLEDNFTRIKNARRSFTNFFETAQGQLLKTPMDAEITAIRSSLDDALKKASKDGFYEAAQDKFAELSEPVSKLVNLQKYYKNLQTPEQIVNKIALGEPSYIKQVGKVIQDENPALYQDIKKAVMQEFFNRAYAKEVKDVDGPVDRGGAFAGETFKNKDMKRKLKALLSKEEYEAFDELTDLLLIASSVNKTGAQTAFISEDVNRLRKGFYERLLENFRFDAPLAVVGKMADAILLGDHADKLAKTVVDPDSQKKLKEIVSISPNEPRVVALMSQLFNKIVQGNFEEERFLNTPE